MNSGSSLRARLLASVFTAGILTAPMAAHAADPEFNIAPQSLDTALADFSRQSMTPVLATPSVTGTKQTPGYVGTSDPQTALAMLLQGTGLTFRRQGDTFLIVSASDPQSGSAAGDGADSGTVQALIVTAQKREENIQDVPIAMSAFSQEDLTRSQVAGGADLMTQVPNMTFTKTNFSSYSIEIRGIGTQAISATTDPAVAVAFNNTPFVSNRFFEQEFYDLQRVEVLRGPQGTLYGRNATAGVVNIISAKPSLSKFEAKVSADVSNYSSSRLEGMINLPIVQDKVAFRLAGAWTKRDGYVTNEITGHPIDGRNLWSTRATLRFEPNDRFHANLIWEHFQEDDDRLRSGKQLCKKHDHVQVGTWDVPLTGGGLGSDSLLNSVYMSTGCTATSLYSPDAFQTPNGFSLPYVSGLAGLTVPIDQSQDAYASKTQSRNLRVIESTVDPHYRAKSDLGELQMAFDLTDHLTLTSETGFNRDFVWSSEDFNRFNTPSHVFDPSLLQGGLFGVPSIPNVLNGDVFCDPQVGCSDRVVAVDLATAKAHQFSQEFRVSSDFDGPFNFSFGANFLRYDTEAKYYVFFNTTTMSAALGGGVFVWGDFMPPWNPGVSDNHKCLNPLAFFPDPRVAPSILECTYIDPNPIGSLNDQGHNYFLSKNPYKLISYATFGESYYQITPALKLTAGLRWTVDKKEAPRIPSWLLAGASVGYPVTEVVRQEWREPTGRLALDWKPKLSFTDETLLYASYAHGYKAGGANPPPAMIAIYLPGTDGAAAAQASVVQPRTFRPEFVNAFEAGSKNTLFDGKMTLNGTAFYYDYKDYQISQIINRSATNYNFDARIWGVELEADWRALENLRFGLKLGYENTRVGKGQKAIDIMDRTAGHTDWVVLRPFATIPSNCIVPAYVLLAWNSPAVNHSLPGSPGDCLMAYYEHLDPVTARPYVLNPTDNAPSNGLYPGFDPSTAPNNGEGFYKDLSGHQLPNAPKYTVTLTADYTLPLPNDWLMTLHGDFYQQSEAWARIFNMPGYDKLKAYNNINLAAIFTNEDAGWTVMAYVKNVLNKDNITGAFLNSDDSGLTTNVFLNEPRLYGLRVTKTWTGAPWWTGGDAAHPAGAPYPLTVELGGGIQRAVGRYDPIAPGFVSDFRSSYRPLASQNRGNDWGDDRGVKITYQPDSAWWVSASVRFGKVNGTRKASDFDAYHGCTFRPENDPYNFCHNYHTTRPRILRVYDNNTTSQHENHTIVDFAVGQDVGFGTAPARITSRAAVGLRYAQLESDTHASLIGLPYWHFTPPAPSDIFQHEQHDRWDSEINNNREFEGIGPMLDWESSVSLLGDAANHLDLDWSAGAGVLFGKQVADTNGNINDEHYNGKYYGTFPGSPLGTVINTPVHERTSKSATVPVLDLSTGLSWQVERFQVKTGYRWERYFNAIDGGWGEHKSFDRTIDGPYLKVSVGFGG